MPADSPPPPLTRTVLDQPPSGGLAATALDLQPPPEALTGAGRGRTIADRSTSGLPVPPPSAPPMLPEAGLEARLDPAAPPASRYAIGALLGSGATSHVYAARDRSFDREVAIKFLEAGLASDGKRLARFMREARITAQLDHPNIVPVYDLDVTPAGDLYLTMRRISGGSLGDLLRRAGEDPATPELGGWNRRVNIMLKVCDALACAHDRGIVHQDVKPDNIMLGPFGEVVLVDWGAARPFDEEPRPARITGTPMYMSPEQAMGLPADALADVYCLGATLFHTLTLRHPTWANDDQEFWAKKRAGIVDPPTAAERAGIPKRLLAIALKAMARDRAERYPSIKALAEDLQHYQAGLAVSAYRDSWLERAVRWHNAHAWSFWLGTAAAATVLASLLFVYGERLKEVAAWGAPVYRQDFDDDAWREQLATIGDAAGWESRDGRVVSTGPLASFLFLPRRLHGPVAVEVEGEMLPGHPPCDLSLAWSAEDPVTTPTWGRSAYLLQTGSHDNTFAAITRVYGNEAMVRSEVRLTSGRRHRLRFEIDHDRLSIDLDGQRICDYRAAFPCTSGYVGLYAYYPGKAFDRLTIYNKGLPQRIAPTAIGDSWYERDQPGEAAEQYRRVVESFPGTPLADEARYKQGLCLARLGRREEALILWQGLREPNVAALAECKRLEWANEEGDAAGAIARFASLYRASPAMRQRLHLVFSNALSVSLTSQRPEDTSAWLDLARDLLPGEPTVDSAAARALNALGRWQETLDRYPHLADAATRALIALGRSDEVTARYPDARQHLGRALLEQGRFGQVLDELPHDPWSRIWILHAQGRHAEALAYVESLRIDTGAQLLRLGLVEEALAAAPAGSTSRFLALHRLGRVAELVAELDERPSSEGVPALLRARLYERALELTPPSAAGRMAQAHLGRWATALERHDPTAAEAALAAAGARPLARDLDDSWFARLVLVDAIRHRTDPAAFAAAMHALAGRGPGWLAQRPWHAARYLLGAIDEAAFLAQPARDHAPAALLALRGVRAELADDRAAALAAYRAYLALPLHERCWDTVDGDAITDHLLEWRVSELQAAP